MYRKECVVAGGRIKKDAQIDKADLIRIKIVLFVQLWHLRNGWHDAHKADLISLWIHRITVFLILQVGAAAGK